MHHKFKEIVCIDKTMLLPEAFEELQQFSEKPIRSFADYPADEGEVIQRIGHADCLLLSWRTQLSARVIRKASNLRYIGMCCSLYEPASANVDIRAAEEQGIEVRAVHDYADKGVVEYVMAQLISLAKGLYQWQWKQQPTELKDKTIGIIGLGKTGGMLADLAQAFGMKVLYFSRTRKKKLEHEKLQYAPLHELLQCADIISTHLPRKQRLLGAEEFALTKPDAILVNTSLGPTFQAEAFESWIQQDRHFAIMDGDGAGEQAALCKKYPDRILFTEQAAGSSDMANERLSRKVIENIRTFLAGKSGTE